MRQVTKELLADYAALMEHYRTMTPAERAELHDWERRNLDGHAVVTTDWYGWAAPLSQPLARDLVPQRTPKQPIPADLRWAVWERDNFTCQCCGARRFLTVDHILAESHGGTLDPANLQTLCRTCNSRKGSK